MVELNNDERLFLKGLKKMTSANDDDVKMIYLLYRSLIDKPELLKEWDDCKCPSVIRSMAFELVIYYMKNKKKIDAKR